MNYSGKRLDKMQGQSLVNSTRGKQKGEGSGSKVLMEGIAMAHSTSQRKQTMLNCTILTGNTSDP